MTTPVEVRWVKRNPKKPSPALTWVFPAQANRTILASLERDLQRFYSIKKPLYRLTIGPDGRCVVEPFCDVQQFDARVVLTLRPYVSPNNLLSTRKYEYPSGVAIKTGDVVHVQGRGIDVYEVVSGKKGSLDDPLVKVQCRTSLKKRCINGVLTVGVDGKEGFEPHLTCSLWPSLVMLCCQDCCSDEEDMCCVSNGCAPESVHDEEEKQETTSTNEKQNEGTDACGDERSVHRKRRDRGSKRLLQCGLNMSAVSLGFGITVFVIVVMLGLIGIQTVGQMNEVQRGQRELLAHVRESHEIQLKLIEEQSAMLLTQWRGVSEYVTGAISGAVILSAVLSVIVSCLCLPTRW